MLHRFARWIEGHAGSLLPALLLIAFWHPSASRDETLPPELEEIQKDPAHRNEHFLAPDAHRIIVERTGGRLLLFRGSSLMAVYPIDATTRTPEGRFVVSGVGRGASGTRLFLAFSDRQGADRGLSSGVLDRKAHARVIRSLAEGEIPAETPVWGRHFSIHGRDPGNADQAGVQLDDEYVRQIGDLVRIGTPVAIR